MDLKNFDLARPSHTTELHALGLHWDLHSFAEFEGLELRVAEDVAVLRWSVPGVENPWGSWENRYQGCRLVFRGVLAVHVTPRDPGSERADDRALADISKVSPELGSNRHRESWPAGAPFHLRFEFESGRTIEVAAQSAELAGIQ